MPTAVVHFAAPSHCTAPTPRDRPTAESTCTGATMVCCALTPSTAIAKGDAMANDGLRANILHRVFALGIWLKGLDGVLEIAGGFIVLLTSNRALNQFVIILTQHELVEDPHDRIANALRQAAAQVSANTKLFASLYLLAHGLAKIVLVVAVLSGKRWAYPATIGFLGCFIVYQLYRLSYHFTVELLLLTLFDSGIVCLTWREYRFRRP